MICWVVFDAVGTLLAPEPSVAEAYHQTAAAFGSRLTVEEIGRRFRKAFVESDTACFPPHRQGRTSEPEERHRWRWIVNQIIDDVSDAEGLFGGLWEHFASRQSWRVFDDVPSIIERLSSNGLKIAIASNFDGRLHGLAEVDPVLSRISTRLVSSEIGYRKPAAEFYRTVIERCGVPAESILMVGDDWEADVIAARRAGLSACWLNRRGVTSAQSISTLADLVVP